MLLLIDSDCIATEDLIARHVAALWQAPGDVAGVVGRILTPVGRSPVALSRSYRECSDLALACQEVSWGPTANLSIRRDVFDVVGGFDERTFTPVGGEDVDLGVRVHEAGYRWLTSPLPTVLHAVESSDSFSRCLGKQFTYGRADVFLTSRHPSRRAWQANPVAAGLLGASLTVPLLPVAPLLPAAACLPILAHIAAALVRGRSTETPPHRRLLGALLDLAFDAGTVSEALRRARPQLALRRFRYAAGPEFAVRVVPLP